MKKVILSLTVAGIVLGLTELQLDEMFIAASKL